MNSVKIESADDRRVDRAVACADVSEPSELMEGAPEGLGGQDWEQFIDDVSAEAYQQTDAWARAKQTEGWQALKKVLWTGGRKEVGYQMFFKQSKVGMIGYIPGGPIPADGDPEKLRLALEQVINDAKNLRLRVVIQQCASRDPKFDDVLSGLGFLPNRFFPIVTATWLTPVSEGMQAVEKSMQTSRRRKVRKARRSGVVIREGTRSDIAEFHELMKKSCERQGVQPNPGSPKFLEALWSDSSDGLRTHIFFAEHEGRRVAARFCICIGTKVHFWKKGNDPEFMHLRAGDLLVYETLAWAHRNGYETTDYQSMKRAAAEHILAGSPLTDEIKQSRDSYAMGFGGHSQLLSEAFVWIPNPVLRMIYKHTACSRLGSRLLRSLYTS